MAYLVYQSWFNRAHYFGYLLCKGYIDAISDRYLLCKGYPNGETTSVMPGIPTGIHELPTLRYPSQSRYLSAETLTYPSQNR